VVKIGPQWQSQDGGRSYSKPGGSGGAAAGGFVPSLMMTLSIAEIM